MAPVAGLANTRRRYGWVFGSAHFSGGGGGQTPGRLSELHGTNYVKFL